ncbi:MAG: DUF4139 domain-containing protein [Saprospiraceae bacterium]|nr:DUF4139 domain-containing protein [Saprospiraceae bacterium]
MKNPLLLIIFVLFATIAFSQNEFHLPSQISTVTVYEHGAMVTRAFDTKNIDSDGVITIDSLPKNIYPKSIQAKCGDGLKILSIKNTQKTETIEFTAKTDSLYNEIEMIKDSVELQNTLLKSIKQEIDVILKNDNFDTEEGTNMDQLIKASDLYKTRLRELNLEQFSIIKKREQFNENIGTLKDKIRRTPSKTYEHRVVEIKIENQKNLDKTLTLSYFSPNASWYTFYDLRVKETDNSYLDHKAFVKQSTGEDWNDVQITLSNRNPNKKISPPSIQPYILQNIHHKGYSAPPTSNNWNGNKVSLLVGQVTDSSGELLIGVNIKCPETGDRTLSDIDGNFTIRKAQKGSIVISYVGYETQHLDVSGLHNIQVTLAEGQQLDEVVVTGYSIKEIPHKPQKKYKKEEVRKAIDIKTHRSLNLHNFELTDMYSIPSNGQEIDVLLNTNNIPFVYKYLTYPSQEPTAYLRVGIDNWKSYDLLSGNVNLFLEGQYTGVSHLNIEAKTDTLWFSLGEDIGVHIEKERIEEFNKKSFLKNKIIELHTFDIHVKNNKPYAIEMDIIDQVPVSTDDDINVKVLEISGAEIDEKQGYLLWKETLAPGERKTYRISYEIKYGKNVDIVSN